MSLLEELKSFIRNRVTTKYNNFKSAWGKKKQSNPYSKTGKHLFLTSPYRKCRAYCYGELILVPYAHERNNFYPRPTYKVRYKHLRVVYGYALFLFTVVRFDMGTTYDDISS